MKSLEVRSPGGVKIIELQFGQSTIFVGANGSGKSRLAIECETTLGSAAHRIAAHRSISMNTSAPKISEQSAIETLRFGVIDPTKNYGSEDRGRFVARWQQKMATSLLADFDHVLQVLFADQASTAFRTHQRAHAGTLDSPELTKFQKLAAIWKRVMPNRDLRVTMDDIEVVVPQMAPEQPPYNAAEMSDGERSVFYLIGQALVAEANAILIFDEPELHVHRAVLGRLWDELEAARPDCAFLLITHDLEFAASRPGQKFVLRSYVPDEGWEFEEVPEDTGFSEEITTLILGSRRPILFVEGTVTSLDVAIYRACYPDWTVIPNGSCENVVHAVVSMRRNQALTRVTCSGIVDADDYSDDDKARLSDLGIAILPVAEIENLVLVPTISSAILEDEQFAGLELENRLKQLKREVFEEAGKESAINGVVLRHCRRRIDRTLKKIDLSHAMTPDALAASYASKTAALDVTLLADSTRKRLLAAIDGDDLMNLLRIFDHKGTLLAIAAKGLKNTRVEVFTSWLTRAMRNPESTRLKHALAEVLPIIVPA